MNTRAETEPPTLQSMYAWDTFDIQSGSAGQMIVMRSDAQDELMPHMIHSDAI